MRKTAWLMAALALSAAACSRAPSATTASTTSTAAAAGDADYASLGKGVDDVSLTSDTGASLKFRDLKGHPRALYFGYTHCPVICPVTVYELTAAAKRIGPSADRVKFEFVTVDPEHDSAAHLHEYFAGFENRVTGYTGSAADLAHVAQAFEVSSRKVNEPNGDYSYDHTPTVFLIDASGTVVDVVGYGSPPEVIEARLRSLLARPQ